MPAVAGMPLGMAMPGMPGMGLVTIAESQGKHEGMTLLENSRCDQCPYGCFPEFVPPSEELLATRVKRDLSSKPAAKQEYSFLNMLGLR